MLTGSTALIMMKFNPTKDHTRMTSKVTELVAKAHQRDSSEVNLTILLMFVPTKPANATSTANKTQTALPNHFITNFTSVTNQTSQLKLIRAIGNHQISRQLHPRRVHYISRAENQQKKLFKRRSSHSMDPSASNKQQSPRRDKHF
jgi:hypothetical protein